MEANGPQPGWYDDAEIPGWKRYWDGACWTDARQPADRIVPGAGPPAVIPGPPKTGGAENVLLKILAVVAVVCLVFIVGCVAVLNNAADKVEKIAENQRETKTTGGKTANVGEPITIEGTQYRVISATTANSVGGEFTRSQPPAGAIYVLVELELVNKKSDTRRFTTEAAKIVTPKGKEYSVDTQASVAGAGDGTALLLEELQPDVPTTGKLIYVVPQDQVSGARLRVEDLFGRGHGFVKLGL